MYCEKLHRRRIILCFVFMAGICGLVGARLAKIQIGEADRYRIRAADQYTGTLTRQALRGRIFDRNGVLLAGNQSLPTVVAIPEAIEDPAQTAEQLSPVLDIPAARLIPSMTKDRKVVYLKRQVDPETQKKVKALNIRGIGFDEEPGRCYPNGTLAAHVLGHCLMDNSGAAGVEAKLDSFLQGAEYKYQVTYDGRRRRLETWNLEMANPNHGIDVILTIDSTVQHFAEQVLERQCGETQALGGSAVILDVKTGDIIACANYPTFDPNRYRDFDEKDRANRATAHLYEPGSVQKVATILAALDDNAVGPDTIIPVGHGTYTIAGHTYTDDHPPYKPQFTVSEVVMVSSNVGAIRISERLGEGKFLAALEKFGFSEAPCSDLPGVACMYFMKPGMLGYSRLSMPSMAFGGAEVMASAMGMAAFFNAVANDGVYVKPHAIRALRSPLDGVERPYQEVETRRIASERATRQVREMMRLVIDEEKGTGNRARIEGISAGGKTGTVRKWDDEAKCYSRNKIIASFGGMLPVDSPRVTIFVVLDEPKTETYGGLVAAPVFKEIAEFCIAYLGIPREISDKEWETNYASGILRRSTAQDRRETKGTMPLLLGMTLGEACSLLLEQDVVPRISGSGIVVWQDPPKDAPILLRPVEIRLAPPPDEVVTASRNGRT
jgi:cell division protein FtsI (penicillin-binding protein 3)